MPSPNPTRREFAATAITAALTAACARAIPAPAPAPAKVPAAPAAPPADAAIPPAATAPAPDPNAEQTEALTTVVFAHYRTVDPARRGDVKDGIARTLLLADRMRKVPVANAVDPFSVCWTPSERAR